MWQNQIRYNRPRTPYIGLLNRPRPRARSRARKIELLELTNKQIEDEHEYENEDDKSVIKSILMAPTGCIRPKQSFFFDQTGRLRPEAALVRNFIQND
jgi:hypothetical protein